MSTGRMSRSDSGVIALTRAVMGDVLGLDNETISKVMKLIRSQGQLSNLKVNLRGLNAVAYKRLNQVIDLIEKDREEDREQKGEEPTEDEPEKKEMKESFVGYLLNELQFDADSIRNDPETKQDVMRLARASDSQARTMTDKMQREKTRNMRTDMQQEQDPQRAALKRKKLALQNQIDKINQQLQDSQE